MHKQTIVGQYRLRSTAVLIGVVVAVAALFAACLLSAPAYAEEEPIAPTVVHNRLLDAEASLSSGKPVEYGMESSWVYGTDPVVAMPRLMYDETVGEKSGELTMTLIYNGESDEVIVTDLTQPKNLATNVLYNGYINQYMPAGDYTLIFALPGVIVGDADKDYEQWWNGEQAVAAADTVYETNTYTFKFSVLKADIPQKYVADINEKLVQTRHEYIYDGEAHFYTLEEELDILTAGNSIYDRGEGIQGVYWQKEEADKYFGGMTITYNLDRMMNDHYHTDKYLASDKELTDCNTVAPREPGEYIVYYQLSGDNYNDLVDISSDLRRECVFYVTVVGVVDIPVIPDVIYNGSVQKGYISENQYYTVDAYDGWTDAGTYRVTLRLRNPEYYLWNGQTLDNKTQTYRIDFKIVKASNDWVRVPDVVRWVEGAYDPEENLVVGEALYGEVTFTITDADGNVVYSNAGEGINKLADLKAGNYNFSATVEGTDNYNALPFSMFIRVLKKQGLPWWGTLCITVGALLAVALVILILYKKGVFRLLTDKIVLSIRTKATVDATIAAVRANKVAAAAQITVEQAEARDKADERAEARKKAAAEERNKSAEEKMAALEAKARVAAERAERMREKAEAMQARVEKFKSRVNADTAEKTETASTESKASADDITE